MTPQEIYNAARTAGDLAVAQANDGYPCGFAWITIRPARGKFVSFLKESGIGRKGYYGGYEISSYEACSFSGQNMYTKEDGCRAFAEVLTANGITTTVNTRID